MTKKPNRRILFVDDDPQLLSGLGKALRKQRDRWTMVFADSGETALAEVRQAPFDVVVSDMRMPAMDGATLLAHIRDHDPTTIRMILSGFSDQNAIVRALPVAHQFFNKPCDLSELRNAIERACELRDLFGCDAMRAVVGRLDALPPPPGVYHELTAMFGSGELRIDAITAVVERDPGLRERVLQSASSPVFGLEHTVRTVAEAVSCIGIEMLVGLALASHAFAMAGDADLQDFSLPRFRHHSLTIARTARDLAATPDVAAEAFIAGLVHDIGKIILAMALPEAHLAIVERMREPGATRRAVEHSLLGTSHAEIGAYLLCQWGLPLQIIDAIAHHDDGTAAATPVLVALRGAHATLP